MDPTSHHKLGDKVDSDYARTVANHDNLAHEYDQLITRDAQDLLARRTFRELVTRHVSPGSTLLDFGCGTGLDALYYAQQGYRVLAYDNSPGMIARLKQRATAEISTGTITPISMEYPAFLKKAAALPPFNAVVANFAVLNLVRAPEPLFGILAAELLPPGWLILCVLNAIHWPRIKDRGWWRDAFKNPVGPRLYIPQPYSIYLHFESKLLRSARGFRLVARAHAGNLVRGEILAPQRQPLWWEEEELHVGSLSRLIWRTPAYKLLGHFVFLVLRRDE